MALDPDFRAPPQAPADPLEAENAALRYALNTLETTNNRLRLDLDRLTQERDAARDAIAVALGLRARGQVEEAWRGLAAWAAPMVRREG